jgi:UDP:flavonoid glycosyltransferase YjiC (YdhE family)
VTRLLLVPFPPAGHAEPMAALAERLRAQGHAVTVFTESAASRWSLDQPVPPEMYASADGGTLFRHLFLGDVVDMTLDIVDLAKACGAERIVADVMMPGGGLAAELTGLPWVSLSTTPVPALDSYRRFIPDHAGAAFAPHSTRAALGLPLDDERGLLARTSNLLHLILSTPRFADFPDLAPEVELVGPFAPQPCGPPRRERSARPTVVVSASTHSTASLGGRGFVQERYLSAAVRALAGLDVDGLVTAHAVAGPPPENVRILGHADHDALFDQAAAVVTHAGWGTVSRALVRGLPLVLVPISGDQPYIAERCADLGIGIALEAETVTAAELREAARAVLEDDRYRKAAGALAAELREAAPLATAVSLITSSRVSEG